MFKTVEGKIVGLGHVLLPPCPGDFQVLFRCFTFRAMIIMALLLHCIKWSIGPKITSEKLLHLKHTDVKGKFPAWTQVLNQPLDNGIWVSVGHEGQCQAFTNLLLLIWEVNAHAYAYKYERSMPKIVRIVKWDLINPAFSRYVGESSAEAFWEDCVQDRVEDWVEVVEHPGDHEEHMLNLWGTNILEETIRQGKISWRRELERIVTVDEVRQSNNFFIFSLMLVSEAGPNGYLIPARYPRYFQYLNPPYSVLKSSGISGTRNTGYTRYFGYTQTWKIKKMHENARKYPEIPEIPDNK